MHVLVVALRGKLNAYCISHSSRRNTLPSDGFVVLAIESFWTRLFSHYFIQTNDETRDDLLFYVKSKTPKDVGKETNEKEVSTPQLQEFMSWLPHVLCPLAKEVFFYLGMWSSVVKF